MRQMWKALIVLAIARIVATKEDREAGSVINQRDLRSHGNLRKSCFRDPCHPRSPVSYDQAGNSFPSYGHPEKDNYNRYDDFNYAGGALVNKGNLTKHGQDEESRGFTELSIIGKNDKGGTTQGLESVTTDKTQNTPAKIPTMSPSLMKTLSTSRSLVNTPVMIRIRTPTMSPSRSVLQSPAMVTIRISTPSNPTTRLTKSPLSAPSQVIPTMSPAKGRILITLLPSERRQTMDGFGGALTWYALRMLTSTHRDELERLVFDDLGLDLIRLKNWYFPTDYPSNKSPLVMPSAYRDNFQANQDFHDMAKKNGRNIRILLSSWTPPQNLKSNGQLFKGGTLAKDTQGKFRYDDLAQYWVDLLNIMDWTPEYVSFQNEPGWVADHETCQFAPTQTAELAGYDEALTAIYQRIKNRRAAPILVGPESHGVQAFFKELVPLRSRSHLGISAFHLYNLNSHSAIDRQIPLLQRIHQESVSDSRPNWMSEFSKGEFDWLDTATVIHNTLVEASSSAYFFFKLVWGNSNSTQEIMINIDRSGEYKVGPTYYAMKHFSKHISRGHQRFEVTGSTSSVRASGYIHPSGIRITLVVLNTGRVETEIALVLGSLPVSYTTAFRTSEIDIDSSPYKALGRVDITSHQKLAARSITTYVVYLKHAVNK